MAEPAEFLMAMNADSLMVGAAVCKYVENMYHSEEDMYGQKMWACPTKLKAADLLPRQCQNADKLSVIRFLCLRGFDIVDLHAENNEDVCPGVNRLPDEWILKVRWRRVCSGRTVEMPIGPYNEAGTFYQAQGAITWLEDPSL
jgi:hypothetical protein